MVTLNLLPFRLLTREARSKRWRRFWPVAVLVFLLFCFSFWHAHKENSFPVRPATVPLPDEASHARVTLAYRETARMQQTFSSIINSVHKMDTLGFHPIRLQLQASGPVLLEGEAPSPNEWLAVLSSFHRQWHLAVKSFRPATEDAGIQFTVSLRPSLRPSLPPAHAAWHPIQNPAIMLRTLLGTSHGTLVLTRLQLPEDDTGVAELQASGSLTALEALIQRLLQVNFFCPLHALRLDNLKKMPTLTLKWQLPCFRQHRGPVLSHALQALRLVGWLQDSKETFALLQQDDKGFMKLGLNDFLPGTQIQVVRLGRHDILLKGRTGIYCLTDKGIQEDSHRCSVT